MIFEYKALDKHGKEVVDHIDAPSETGARIKLKQSGVFLVSIKKEEIKPENKKGVRNKFHNAALVFSRSSSKKQIALFSRQMGTLLSAGMPLLTVLNDIIEQLDHKIFKGIIIDVRDKIEEGTSLSRALGSHNDVFSEMYISMIRVGENLGSLSEVVMRLAEMEEKKAAMVNKIRAVMWYPAFMLIFSMIIMTFLMVKIIPTISEVFLEQDRALPLPTEIVISISNFLQHYWLVIPFLLLISIYAFKKYQKTPNGRIRIDRLKMNMPIFNRIYNKLIVYRFTQNMGILISNRVDILKSFDIVKTIVNNKIIEEKIEGASGNIREGASISQSLKKHAFLPKLVIGMISAGEASDKVDEMMLNIGRVYEEEIDVTINSLTALIEPLIIIVMGVIIGVIVLSIMMPIMEMNLMVQ